MTWQSDRARTFKKRTEGKLAAHWDEITHHLAPPTIAWRWGESGLPTAMKHYLKDKGLIRRAPDGQRWMTSMDLWCYVIEKAGDDEAVGVEATGQQTLDAPPKSESSRVLAPKTRSPGQAVQTTLTGDTVESPTRLNWEGVRENRMKDPTQPSDREKAAERPGQTTLFLAADYDLANWDVTAPWFRSSVTVPTGNVY